MPQTSKKVLRFHLLYSVIGYSNLHIRNFSLMINDLICNARIHKMDEALLRPGRLCKRLFVSLPSPEQGGLILKALGKNRPIDDSVNLIDIGRMEACSNFSGADLNLLVSFSTYIYSNLVGVSFKINIYIERE